MARASVPRTQAVIFELAGTLVDFPTRQYLELTDHLGSLVGVSGATFNERFWAEANRAQREMDRRRSIRATWQMLGCSPHANAEREAFSRYLAFECQLLEHPKPGAREVVRDLNAAGYLIGLITNTVPPIPELWPACSFAGFIDVAVLSCVEGVLKPAPAIYERCAKRLGVEPGRCLFVGDGSEHELDGAVEAGMTAVMCCVPDGDHDLAEIFGRQEWDGPRIAEFSQILNSVRLVT